MYFTGRLAGGVSLDSISANTPIVISKTLITRSDNNRGESQRIDRLIREQAAEEKPNNESNSCDF